jgi:hypothetical protein
MESNYDKYVMGQTMGKFGVISVHLWLEHLLVLCVRTVVPNPEPLFRDRGISFPLLVSLCEAHQVIDAPLADILRKVNALRNKCAHQLTFNPREPDYQAIHIATEQLVPAGAQSEGEGPLRLLAELVEQKAIEIGAIQADTTQQSLPAASPNSRRHG